MIQASVGNGTVSVESDGPERDALGGYVCHAGYFPRPGRNGRGFYGARRRAVLVGRYRLAAVV